MLHCVHIGNSMKLRASPDATTLLPPARAQLLLLFDARFELHSFINAHQGLLPSHLLSDFWLHMHSCRHTRATHLHHILAVHKRVLGCLSCRRRHRRSGDGLVLHYRCRCLQGKRHDAAWQYTFNMSTLWMARAVAHATAHAIALTHTHLLLRCHARSCSRGRTVRSLNPDSSVARARTYQHRRQRV
jgi:hypothetical protein